MKFLSLSFFLFFTTQSLLAYSIDTKKISVSGISSGAYMAGQMHVSHSSVFMGAGLIAGGPYYCAQGDLPTALNSCMDTYLGAPEAPRLLNAARDFVKLGLIDDLENLKTSQVFILTGKTDQTVLRKVVDKSVEFYQKAGVPAASLKYITQLNMGHAFPTDSFGNACSTPSESPWISACKYDGAGELLKHIYGDLKPKTVTVPKNFFKFSQAHYARITPDRISMGSEGIAYVPDACQTARAAGLKCALHVVFHGCRQTQEEMGDEFYTNAGYTEWAEANNMILLFPQATSNILLGNPKGCWDWWGYTGPHFADQTGPQIQAVFRMVQEFSSPEFKLPSRK